MSATEILKLLIKIFERCEQRNKFVSSAVTVPKYQFGGFYCSFGTVTAVLDQVLEQVYRPMGSKLLAKYFFRTH